jgi:hypothetical protein
MVDVIATCEIRLSGQAGRRNNNERNKSIGKGAG